MTRDTSGGADRFLVHVDIDAFFASVEQLLIPRLRGRSVAVGSGVIASCSYEARAHGLHAGMALHRARQACPDLVVLAGQYPIYRCFAEHVWGVCRRFTNGLETFLDEAYGDVTGLGRLLGPPPALGRSLRQAVLKEVGLSLSVGLAPNRMLAKMASKAAKPAGVVCVEAGQEQAFLAGREVAALPGVGPATQRMLADLNIHTVEQLRVLDRPTLEALLGERGLVLHERCRGRDPVPARPDEMRTPRTISRETTFHQPQCDPQAIRAMLSYLLERAMRTVRGHRLAARRLELTIRYDDWKQRTARQTLAGPTDIDTEALAVAYALLDRLHTRRVALRHVGVVLSGFVPAEEGPKLFAEPTQRQRDLHGAVDRIRARWGHGAVVQGGSINLLGTLGQNDHGFVLRTPSLTK